MAILNTTYHTGEDTYIDDEEDALLAHYSGQKLIEDPKDTMYYLMTSARENIISWYPFKRKKILEIGCGCGCVTGALCRMGSEVVSVDQSVKRATITYTRHKNEPNLSVYAGNISEIPFDCKFDYVVVVGVLEYARRFFDKEPQDQEFLSLIRGLLKDDGVLLLAIENRFGLKYFAGANEDHLGRRYASLEGYDKETILTYGRDELTALLNRMGFSKTAFYYPFPDYKLPSVIFSERRKPNEAESATLPEYFYGQSAEFNVYKTMQGLFSHNDGIGLLANSFLVEAGTPKSIFSDVCYAKFTPKRATDYQIQTVLKEETDTSKALYIKRPSMPAAKDHLRNYSKIHQKIQQLGIPSVPVAVMCDEEGWYSEKRQNSISVPERLRDVWYEQGCVGVETELDSIIRWLQQQSKWEELIDPIIPELFSLYPNGTYVIPLGLMDMNANNLLYEPETGYVLIDQEWTCEKQIPLDYAIMCTLGYLETASSVIRTIFTGEALLQRYEITPEKCDILKRITSEYFSKMIHHENIQASRFFQQLERHSVQSDSQIIEQLHAQLEESYKENARLLTEYNRVVKLYESGNIQLQEISGEYNRLAEEKKQVDVQVNDLSVEYKRVVKLVDSQSEQLNHINREYDRVVELFEEKESQLQRISSEYNRVVDLLTQSDTQLKHIDGEYLRVINLLDEKNEQIQNLSKEYTRTTELISDLDSQVKHLSEEYNRVLALYQQTQQ